MNILFTSAGRRSYLIRYFKEAVGADGEIFAANSTPVSPALQAADHAVVTPLIYDREYIPFLLQFCEKNHIDALISLFDIDLPVLAAAREKFEAAGVRLLVSGLDFVKICNDKWETCRFLEKNHIMVPRSFLRTEAALDAVRSGGLLFPLIVKPRWGMGSISVYQADDEGELDIFYQKVKKNVRESALKYESAADMEECVLIQEKLEGQEYGLDIINDLDGNYQTTVCKLKYAMRAGETDCAVTVDDKRLKELGRMLSGLSGHIGNLDCDVFVSGSRIYVLEMNARFGGGYPFSHVAGADLVGAIVKWLKGEPVPPDMLQERTGVMVHKDIGLTEINLAEQKGKRGYP